MSDFLRFFNKKSRQERVGESFFNSRSTPQHNIVSRTLATPATAFKFHGSQGTGKQYGLMKTLATLTKGEV